MVSSRNRCIIAVIVFLLAATMLTGVVFTALIREKIPAITLTRLKQTHLKYEQKLAAKWINAVEQDNQRQAIYTASLLIVPEEPLPLPVADALKYSKDNGLVPLLFSTSLSTVDYFRWRDAWMLKHTIGLITKNNFSVEDILHFVLTIKPAYAAAGGRLVNLLENGCPDIYASARLFCGMAEQAGFDSKIGLLTEANGMPAYILIAITRGSQRLIIDLPGRKIYKNCDINSFVPPGDWPDELKNAFRRQKLMLQPSEFQDFRPANQRLNYKLNQLAAGKIPIFGRPPEILLAEFSTNSFYGNPDKYYYWDEAFNAVKHLPEVAKWITNKQSPARITVQRQQAQ